MKQLVVLLYMLPIVSCNQNAFENKERETTPIQIIKTDNAEIFGKWTMCFTSSYSMNVCSVFQFNNNGTGTVSHSEVVDEYFTWALKNGVLTIVHVDRNGRQTLEDRSYSATFRKQSDRMMLTISNTEDDYECYLTR